MADWGGAASGALSGAATGATLGSAYPVIGTGIGAAGGALVGGVAGLFGKKKNKKKSTFDKRQNKLNEQQFAGLQGQGPFSDLYNYDPEAANDVFDKIQARPAQRNFSENTVPTITGAFRNQGLQNSSYAGDALSKAGRDVQENLDALRAQYLYGEKGKANEAKRGALEGFQNRNTQYFDKANQGGFDIDSILKSISPENISALKEALK